MSAVVRAVDVAFGRTKFVTGVVGAESNARSGVRAMVKGGAR